MREQEWTAKWYGNACQVPLVTIDHFGHKLRVHKRARRAFARYERIMWQESPAYARRIRDNTPSGTYNCRPIGGTDLWSTHAYGTSVDHLAPENWVGVPKEKTGFWIHARGFVNKMLKEDFMTWGVFFPNPDGMHWQVKRTPFWLFMHYRLDGLKRGEKFRKGRK